MFIKYDFDRMCCIVSSSFLVNYFVLSSLKCLNKEFFSEFDFGYLLSNGLAAFLNTAIGRDCKGRPQGDYFYGCQVASENG